MPKFAGTNIWVRIASVDLSDHIQEVNVDCAADDVETTSMGALGKTRIQGLRDDKFDFTAFSDFDAAKVDATIWPLFSGGSAFLVEVAPAGTVISSTNPKYSGTVILTEYQPIAAKVGDAAMTKLPMPVSGYISRATV